MKYGLQTKLSFWQVTVPVQYNTFDDDLCRKSTYNRLDYPLANRSV